MNSTFNRDVVELSNEIRSGKINDNNVEEVIRRAIAYMIMDAMNVPEYREEVDLYIQQVES